MANTKHAIHRTGLAVMRDEHLEAANDGPRELTRVEVFAIADDELRTQFPAEPDPRHIPSDCDERFSEHRAREFQRNEARQFEGMFPGADA